IGPRGLLSWPSWLVEFAPRARPRTRRAKSTDPEGQVNGPGGPTQRVSGGDDLAERVDEQVDVGLAGHDRRREADGLAVGLLGQDPLAQQGFGEVAAGHLVGRDVDPGPQAARADGVDAMADQVGEADVELLAELGRALLELAGL